jgi:hypothetical protein
VKGSLGLESSMTILSRRRSLVLKWFLGIGEGCLVHMKEGG